MSSDSEEDILIYTQFDDGVNIEKYKSIHLLGITEKTPVIQMDEHFFQGNFVNSLGTYMFFEDDDAPKCEDVLFDKLPEKNLKYITKTQKLLNMTHSFVTPKEGIKQEVEYDTKPEEDIQITKFNSIQEGLEKFKHEFYKIEATNDAGQSCVPSTSGTKKL